MQKLKIGFIGLGLMGRPMALNILKKGFSLGVYNRTPEKTKEFVKLGASVYDSPAELAKNCDVVITMVTGPKDVRQVIFDKDGVAESLKDEGIIVDMSTIGPTAAGEIAADLKECNLHFLDAPVTGSTNRAESGELTIFVGGEKKIFERVKPVLEAMGTDIVYMGEEGLGQAIKLVNNMIVAESLTALAEGFLLGEMEGLPKEKIAAALQNVFGLSPVMKAKMPNMVKSNYPTAFSLKNMRKDLKLALEELKGKKLELLKITEKIHRKGIDKGFGELDNSAVLKVLEEGKH